MRPLWRLALPIILFATIRPGATRAQSSTAADLTGTWLFTVTTDGGSGTPTVTLTQKADTLTGHYSSQVLGEADLKGSVKDAKFSFTVQADVQGTTVAVTYTGTIESKDSLKGTVDLGGMASGTFTAKRSERRPEVETRW